MMMPPDPLRQKMLFKTEWRSIGCVGTPKLLATEMNQAFQSLAAEGFNISQILPTQDGVLVLGQRISSPVQDPTPQGVPLPGTSATQNVEVIYSYAVAGEVEHETMKSLQDAVRRAARDMKGEEGRQPISIHVTSITAYGPGDLPHLCARFA